MKNAVLVSLTVLAFCAGSASAQMPDESLAAEIPTADAFNPIQRYAIVFDKPRDVAEFYLKNDEFNPYHADFEVIDDPSSSTDRILFATIDGIKDDAVQGIQWRFRMRPSEGRWEAVEAGMRRKCYRGENAGEWTRDLCP